MVRKIEVVVPEDKVDQIRDVLELHRAVHHLVVIRIENGRALFKFKVVNKKVHDLVVRLNYYGVGNRFGSIDVIPISSSKPRITTYRHGKIKKKEYNLDDSLSYDEIFESIDSQLHLTFDYLALIVVGAMIAAVGLLTDSSVSVVASMLVSPLMGPILGVTFGYIVGDTPMLRKSIRNELVGVVVCFITGCFFGLAFGPLSDPKNDKLAFGQNTQMSSRGDLTGLAWGAMVAIPSGLGVALGVTSNQVSALIGVAISAALLPPITNSGLCLCMGLVYQMSGKSFHVSRHYTKTGMISMVLFLMNWILIFLGASITFRVKQLHKERGHDAKQLKLDKFSALEDKLRLENALVSSGPSLFSSTSDILENEGDTAILLKNPASATHGKSRENKLKGRHKSQLTTPLIPAEGIGHAVGGSGPNPVIMKDDKRSASASTQLIRVKNSQPKKMVTSVPLGALHESGGGNQRRESIPTVVSGTPTSIRPRKKKGKDLGPDQRRSSDGSWMQKSVSSASLVSKEMAVGKLPTRKKSSNGEILAEKMKDSGSGNGYGSVDDMAESLSKKRRAKKSIRKESGGNQMNTGSNLGFPGRGPSSQHLRTGSVDVGIDIMSSLSSNDSK